MKKAILEQLQHSHMLSLVLLKKNVLKEGMDYVIVGGEIIYKDKKLAGTYSGKVIRYNK